MNLFDLPKEELKEKSGVYKLSSGGHIYIGSSKNLYNRLLEHRADLLKNAHPNDFLQNVFNKYGKDNMSVEIVEFCSPKNRINRESFWIKKLNADINMTDPITHELSEESKKKLSESIIKGRKEGKYLTCYDLSQIECYDYFGDFITSFKNREEAAEKLNMKKSDIQRLASGYRKGKSKKGIRLRYANSKVPPLKFSINPKYLGKYYDFYYINEKGQEELAFHDVKDLYPFMASQLMNKKDKITIIPKLKTL